MIMWTALISGYTDCGYGVKALDCFKKMQGHGVFPDTVTYVGLVRAFAIAGNFEGGKSICVEMIRNNCLPKVLSRLELGCALHGMTSTEQIERFLQDIETKGHVVSVFTYNNMLQYLLDKQMLSEAIKIFGRFSGDNFLYCMEAYLSTCFAYDLHLGYAHIHACLFYTGCNDVHFAVGYVHIKVSSFVCFV